MRFRTIVRSFLAGVLAAGVLLACDKDRRSVIAPHPPPPPSGGSGSSPVLSRVEVAGPASVAPQQTAQYTANGVYSDGSNRDLTNEATWRIEPSCCPNPPSPVMSVTAGLVTGLNSGESVVAASFQNRTSRKTVFVLPEGTFRHAGTVSDSGFPLSDAQAAVIAGPATGLVARTDASGIYRMYGVSGDTEIRISKPGYVDEFRRLTFTSNSQSLVFNMALVVPRGDVAGTYMLTITAAPECASNLPEQVQTRTYGLVLEQTGPRLKATLQGNSFYRWGNTPLNTFQGALEAQTMTFTINPDGIYYYYYRRGVPDVVELLAGTTYFAMWGSAVLTGSGSRFSGTFNGELRTTGGPPAFPRTAFCTSTTHRFELSR